MRAPQHDRALTRAKMRELDPESNPMARGQLVEIEGEGQAEFVEWPIAYSRFGYAIVATAAGQKQVHVMRISRKELR